MNVKRGVQRLNHCGLIIVNCELFISHGIHRLYAHGPDGRRETGHHAQHDEESQRSERGPESYLEMGRHDAVVGVGHLEHLQDEHSEEYAAHAGHRGERDALRNNLRQYHLGRGPDGSSDAYLGGTLAHRNHHDVGDTDASGQQRAYTDQPNQEVDTLEQAVHHAKHHLSIENRDGLFIGRVNAMRPPDDIAQRLRQVAHGHTRFSRDTNEVYHIAQIIEPLQNG